MPCVLCNSSTRWAHYFTIKIVYTAVFFFCVVSKGRNLPSKLLTFLKYALSLNFSYVLILLKNGRYPGPWTSISEKPRYCTGLDFDRKVPRVFTESLQLSL